MFTFKKPLAWEMIRTDEPNWEPLLEFAPDHIGDFMWMFEAELEDGARLQAYKHRWTRRYLHLTDELRAYVYGEEDNIYFEVYADELLTLVLPKDGVGIPGYTAEGNGEGDGFNAR